MVTAAVPVEERISVLLVVAPTATLPNDMLLELVVSVAVAAFRVILKVSLALPAVAVSVADCPVLTVVAVAVKLPDDDPDATITDAGTVTAELLLDRPTANPPPAAAVFSVTVQASVPAPVMDALVHETPVRIGMPVPLRLTGVDDPVEELLAMARTPLATPAIVGSNCTVSVTDWFGFRVCGKVAPDTVKPAPDIATEFTVSAVLPVEESLMVCVVAVLTLTLPKERLLALRPSVGTVAPSVMLKVWLAPPAVAISVSDCAVLTVVTVAENVPVDDPLATVTVDGTVTAELLLARLTANPPVVAAAFSVTVQESVPAPVYAEVVHARPLNTGTPVPLRLMLLVVPVEELLVTTSEPLEAPAVAGSNFTVSAAVWPEFRVSGKVCPETE
jgi:hypothetical protein